MNAARGSDVKQFGSPRKVSAHSSSGISPEIASSRKYRAMRELSDLLISEVGPRKVNENDLDCWVSASGETNDCIADGFGKMRI